MILYCHMTSIVGVHVFILSDSQQTAVSVGQLRQLTREYYRKQSWAAGRTRIFSLVFLKCFRSIPSYEEHHKEWVVSALRSVFHPKVFVNSKVLRYMNHWSLSNNSASVLRNTLTVK